MNKLEEMIQQAAAEAPCAGQQEMLHILQAQAAALAEHPSDKEVEDAIQQAITAYLQISIPDSAEQNLSASDAALLEAALRIVQQYLDDHHFVYETDNTHPHFTMYYFGGRTEYCTLKMRILVSIQYRTCCIEAVLPLSVDSTYAYPLCQAICRENHLRRYGALRYNEEDGVLSYRYNLPIDKGLTVDELERLVGAVARSASDGYLALKKHCSGQYDARDTEDILQSLEKLVDALRKS